MALNGMEGRGLSGRRSKRNEEALDALSKALRGAASSSKAPVYSSPTGAPISGVLAGKGAQQALERAKNGETALEVAGLQDGSGGGEDTGFLGEVLSLLDLPLRVPLAAISTLWNEAAVPLGVELFDSEASDADQEKSKLKWKVDVDRDGFTSDENLLSAFTPFHDADTARFGDMPLLRVNDGTVSELNPDGEKDGGWEKAFKLGGAFVGDLAANPVNYATFGAGMGAKALGSARQVALSGSDVAKDAIIRSGKAEDLVSTSLRQTTPTDGATAARKALADLDEELKGLEARAAAKEDGADVLLSKAREKRNAAQEVVDGLEENLGHTALGKLKAVVADDALRAQALSEVDDTARETFLRSQGLTPDQVADFELARVGLIDAAAKHLGSGYAAAGKRGSIAGRRYLETKLGEDLGREALAALPKELKGGVGLRTPWFLGKKEEVAPGLKMRPVKQFSEGSGLTLEKFGKLDVPGAAPLARGLEKGFAGANAARNLAVTRGPLAPIFNNLGEGTLYTGALNIMRQADEGSESSLDNAAREFESLVGERQGRAAQSYLKNSMDKEASRIFDSAEQTMKRTGATTEQVHKYYHNRALLKAGPVSDDAAEVGAHAVADLLRKAEEKAYKRALDRELAEGELEDERRITLDGFIYDRERRTISVQSTNSDDNSRDAYFQADPGPKELLGRSKAVWEPVTEINARAAAQGKEAMFEEDPFKVSKAVLARNNKRVAEHEFRKTLVEHGVIVEVDSLTRPYRNRLGLKDIAEGYEEHVQTMLTKRGNRVRAAQDGEHARVERAKAQNAESSTATDLLDAERVLDEAVAQGKAFEEYRKAAPRNEAVPTLPKDPEDLLDWQEEMVETLEGPLSRGEILDRARKAREKVEEARIALADGAEGAELELEKALADEDMWKASLWGSNPNVLEIAKGIFDPNNTVQSVGTTTRHAEELLEESYSSGDPEWLSEAVEYGGEVIERHDLLVDLLNNAPRAARSPQAQKRHDDMLAAFESPGMVAGVRTGFRRPEGVRNMEAATPAPAAPIPTFLRDRDLWRDGEEVTVLGEKTTRAEGLERLNAGWAEMSIAQVEVDMLMGTKKQAAKAEYEADMKTLTEEEAKLFELDQEYPDFNTPGWRDELVEHPVFYSKSADGKTQTPRMVSRDALIRAQTEYRRMIGDQYDDYKKAVAAGNEEEVKFHAQALEERMAAERLYAAAIRGDSADTLQVSKTFGSEDMADTKAAYAAEGMLGKLPATPYSMEVSDDLAKAKGLLPEDEVPAEAVEFDPSVVVAAGRVKDRLEAELDAHKSDVERYTKRVQEAFEELYPNDKFSMKMAEKSFKDALDVDRPLVSRFMTSREELRDLFDKFYGQVGDPQGIALGNLINAVKTMSADDLAYIKKVAPSETEDIALIRKTMEEAIRDIDRKTARSTVIGPLGDALLDIKVTNAKGEKVGKYDRIEYTPEADNAKKRGVVMKTPEYLANTIAASHTAQALERMHAYQDPKRLSQMYDSVYAPLTALWKFFATSGRGPGFTARNLSGGIYNAAIMGAEAGDFVLGYRYARAVIKVQRAFAKRLEEGATLTADEAETLFDDMLKVELKGIGDGGKFGNGTMWDMHQTMVERGTIADNINAAALGELDAAKVMDGTARDLWAHYTPEQKAALPLSAQLAIKSGNYAVNNSLSSALVMMNQTAESFLRASAFFSQVRKYGNDETGRQLAHMFTVASQFNYSKAALSPLEQRMTRSLVPFWVWMKSNLPLQIRSLAHNPSRPNFVIETNDTLREGLGAEGDFELDGVTPEYAAKNMGWVSKLGGENPLVFQVNNPLMDAHKMLQLPKDASIQGVAGALSGVAEAATGGINPLVKTGIEQFSGTNTFTGQPFKDTAAPGWLSWVPGATHTDPVSGETMASERLTSTLQNLLPPLGQGARLIPGLGTKSAGERLPTAWWNNTVGGLLPVTPSTQLTESAVVGGLRSANQEREAALASWAGESGVDPQWFRDVASKLRVQGLSEVQIRDEMADLLAQGYGTPQYLRSQDIPLG